MSDKIVVKYTRNGVVEENLATKETKQLTTSDWGSQIKYEKQEQFRYNGRSEIEFKNDNSNDILTYRNSKNNNENEVVRPASESYYSPNENKEYQKDNDNKEFVYQKINKKDKEYFDKTGTKKNEYLAYTQKSNIYSYLNDNVYENDIESTHSSHQSYSNNKKFGKSIFKNRNNKNVSNIKSISKKACREPFSPSNSISLNNNNSVGNSEILKGIDTKPPKAFETSHSSDVSNQVLQKKGGIKQRAVKEVSKVFKGSDEEKSSELTHSWLFKLIISTVPILGITVLLPMFLLFVFSGIEGTTKQIEKSHNVISSYILQLDNNLKKEIDDKVAEDKKQPNTEVVVENKEVIGTMAKQISAVAISKFGYVESLTENDKNIIGSIHNLTYEYRIVINNDKGKIKKTYRIMALSLDELMYQMGLNDEEKSVVNQVLQILNQINIPDGGGDIPPANPDGFANPMKTGTYTVTQWYGENGHKGIDLGAGEGTPIYASADGVVRFAGFGDASNGFNRYGYCVFIDHQNGFYTMYAHASSLFVSTGQTVKQGQRIAGVGNTGQSFGNHLHFEIRGGIQQPRYNPSNYINF